MEHEEAKEMAEENEMKNEDKDSKHMRRKFLDEDVESKKEENNKKMLRCSKILERMVNQNNYDDIAIGTFSTFKHPHKTII